MEKVWQINCAIGSMSILLLIMPTSCNRRHLYTNKLPHGFYVESFSSGVAGMMTAQYLTDSTSFKKYIGCSDDETSWYYYHFKGESILIDEMESDQALGETKTVKRQVYRMSNLKSPSIFLLEVISKYQFGF